MKHWKASSGKHLGEVDLPPHLPALRGSVAVSTQFAMRMDDCSCRRIDGDGCTYARNEVEGIQFENIVEDYMKNRLVLNGQMADSLYDCLGGCGWSVQDSPMQSMAIEPWRPMDYEHRKGHDTFMHVGKLSFISLPSGVQWQRARSSPCLCRRLRCLCHRVDRDRCTYAKNGVEGVTFGNIMEDYMKNGLVLNGQMADSLYDCLGGCGWSVQDSPMQSMAIEPWRPMDYEHRKGHDTFMHVGKLSFISLPSGVQWQRAHSSPCLCGRLRCSRHRVDRDGCTYAKNGVEGVTFGNIMEDYMKNGLVLNGQIADSLYGMDCPIQSATVQPWGPLTLTMNSLCVGFSSLPSRQAGPGTLQCSCM